MRNLQSLIDSHHLNETIFSSKFPFKYDIELLSADRLINRLIKDRTSVFSYVNIVESFSVQLTKA